MEFLRKIPDWVWICTTIYLVGLSLERELIRIRQQIEAIPDDLRHVNDVSETRPYVMGEK